MLLDQESSKRQKSDFRRRVWSSAALEQRIMLAGDAGAACEVSTACDATTQPTQVDSADAVVSHTIVFIDSSLENLETLTDGLPRDSELVLLNSRDDALAQVSRVLSQRAGVSAVHIVTHGRAGELSLGDQTIDATLLTERSGEIRSWANAMTDNADILIYGCEAGQGSAGAEFTSLLASLTGADVAASTNLTGNATLSGDWILEVQTGKIESLVAFDANARNRFRHVLPVEVFARGETGEESFDLLIDDVVVESWTATTEFETYIYDGELEAGSNVKVRFTNDLYQPEIGFDRNLTVESVVIDGQYLPSFDDSVFSTGVWLEGEGVQPGFGRGDTLHANGYFEYDVSPEFGGAEWFNNNPNESALYVIDDQLTLVSFTGDVSAWRTADVQAGQVYNFTVDGAQFPFADRDIGFASVGIDFRNATGSEIGERIIDLPIETAGPNSRTIEFVAPEGTTSGTIWVWAGGETEIILNEVTLEQIDLSDDTEPPSATLLPNQLATQRGDSVSFVVDYADNERLGSPARLRVTGPNGFENTAVTFTGSGNGITEQRLLHGVFREGGDPFNPGRDWGPEDNGEYTVTLIGGTLTDQAGNAAPEQVLGTFSVNISSEVDAIPPTAELLTQTSIVNESGEAQFLLQYTDNEAPVQFVNAPGPDVTVTGPNGYNESFNGFAGGAGEGPNQTIEAFVLPPGPNGYVPGEYFVTINDNVIVDISGNVLPSQLLGSFILEVGAIG